MQQAMDQSSWRVSFDHLNSRAKRQIEVAVRIGRAVDDPPLAPIAIDYAHDRNTRAARPQVREMNARGHTRGRSSVAGRASVAFPTNRDVSGQVDLARAFALIGVGEARAVARLLSGITAPRDREALYSSLRLPGRCGATRGALGVAV
jgi:hypothetical protein